jgi:hypothetical protein
LQAQAAVLFSGTLFTLAVFVLTGFLQALLLKNPPVWASLQSVAVLPWLQVALELGVKLPRGQSWCVRGWYAVAMAKEELGCGSARNSV